MSSMSNHGNNRNNGNTHSFHAYDVARALIRALAPLLPHIDRHDRDLGRQLRRASNSIPLNVREANRRLKGDRTHLFSVAAGSAGEVQAILEICGDWGYLQPSQLTKPLELADRELALLWRLTHPRR